MTNGRNGGGISREEAARDGGWATTVLRMECGGMVGADATAWGYTSVHALILGVWMGVVQVAPSLLLLRPGP
jgi:hypothetical protein